MHDALFLAIIKPLHRRAALHASAALSHKAFTNHLFSFSTEFRRVEGRRRGFAPLAWIAAFSLITLSPQQASSERQAQVG